MPLLSGYQHAGLVARRVLLFRISHLNLGYGIEIRYHMAYVRNLTGFYDRKQENLMGEGCKDALRLNFDRKLKLEFHGTKVASDAGLPAYQELDGVPGVNEDSRV